jgi:phage-related protein
VSTPACDGLVGDATIRVDGDTDPATRALARFSRDVNGRLRDINGRFAAAGADINRSLTSAGDQGRSALSGITGALSRMGTVAGPAFGALGTGMAAVSAGALVAGGALAALPLAIAGLGAFALRENEQVKAAFADTAKSVQSTLAEAAQPLVPVFTRVAGQITGIVEGLAPQLGQLFTAVAPMIEPFVASLGKLAENALPGIIAATEAAGPVLAALGSGLEQIGTGVSGFFEGLASGAAGGAEALSGLLGAVGGILPSLGELVGSLAQVGGPVLSTLTSALVPLVSTLGDSLSPVIAALGPVLQAAAGAVGMLVESLLPLLPVVGNLVASLLPPLVPAINAIAQAWAGAAPIVQQLANILTVTLAPIIAQLPAILTPLINTFTQVTAAILPLVAQLLTALTPALTTLGQSFAEILVAVGPLIGVLGGLLVQAISALTPVITPVIALVGRLAAIMASELATRVNTIVVPALAAITALLRGDFSGAFENAKRVVSGMVGTVVRLFTSLPGQIFTALGSLAGKLRERASGAGSALLKALRDKIGDAVEAAKGLPGRAKDALGSLGGYLADSGRALIQGFIDGITSKIGAVTDAVGSVVGAARDLFPGSPAKKGPFSGRGWVLYSGRAIGEGLAKGIAQRAGMARRSAEGLVDGVVTTTNGLLGIASPSKVFTQIGRQTGQGFIKGLTGERARISSTAKTIISSITKAFRGTGSRTDDRLVALVQRGNVRLQSLAKQRDAIAQRIADAQKFASDLAGRARASGGLASIVQPDFFAPSYIEKEMRKSLAQIKSFTANVTKLQKKGLSKDLIRQILELGPEAGAQFAASLAGADAATIKRFNKLQSQIGSASSKLGKQGADMLFDSGKKAGQGFLTGLKAQQKQIEQLMLRIAKGMQKAIRKALGIRSPSRVMSTVGRMTVLGLEGGITRMVPAVDEAMARVAQAVTTGVPTALPAALGGTGMPALGVGTMRTAGAAPAGATVNITLNLTNQGVIGSRMEAENWLARALDNLDRTGRLPKTLRAA